MRTATVFGLILFSVCAVAAQWTERTASWTAQGLGPTSSMVTDPSTATVYYLSGLTVKSYEPTTDSWTDLNPAIGSGVIGYSQLDRAFWSPSGQKGRIVSYSDYYGQVDVYDLSANIWYRNPVPTDDYGFSWGQGALYNTLTGTVWCFWTFAGDPWIALVGAPYYPATDTWGTAEELRFEEDYYWGRMKSATVGSSNYSMDDNTSFVAQLVKMRLYDLAQPSAFPVHEPTQYTSIYDLGPDRALAAGIHGPSSSFGTQIMAVIGDDIFLSGVQESDLLLVYHTLTDSWEELPPRPNNDTTLGSRNHCSNAAGGIVYVRDGTQFWTFRPLVFTDGFESGNTAAWTATIP